MRIRDVSAEERLSAGRDQRPGERVRRVLRHGGGELHGSGHPAVSSSTAAANGGAGGSEAIASVRSTGRSMPAESGPFLGSTRERFGPRRESLEPKDRLLRTVPLEDVADSNLSALRDAGSVVLGLPSSPSALRRSAASSAAQRVRSARSAASRALFTRSSASIVSGAA